jgi:beta-phosphoglucomutase-like phosphatase (HAD superfamily)
MVAVEDSPQGAHAARAAGLETFVLEPAGGGALWPQGCRPVQSLTDLAGLLWPRD